MNPVKSIPAFASAHSEQPDIDAACQEIVTRIRSQMDGPASLALLFFSAHFVEQAAKIADQLKTQLEIACLLGCSGESIVGVETEIEMEPAISLWVAQLPGTTLLPIRLEFQKTPDGGSIIGWPDSLLDTWPQDATLLVLGDPFSFPVDFMLEQINQQPSGVSVVGGMASAAQQPGGNRLVLDGEVYDEGAVAVLLNGNIRIRTVVSQGCRPIGQHFVITQAERNVIQQLGGVPAYQKLQEVYATLATSEQRMVQSGLHVGRVVNEYQDEFEQGDFLVRNVVGADPDQGGIAIGDYVRPGQTVQFHVRDATTADGELAQLLAAARDSATTTPGAALLFTCNGRGTRLFPEPHHDARAIRTALGEIPLAGFFAAGEIGPIGGKNFLHGFTASIAIFEAAS